MVPTCGLVIGTQSLIVRESQFFLETSHGCMWFPRLVAVKMFLIPQVLEPILEPQLAIWISGLLLKILTLRMSIFIVQDLGLNFFWAFFFLYMLSLNQGNSILE